MKILGVTSTSQYRPTYIAEISLDEINKVMNNAHGKFYENLNAGDLVNLHIGYDFKNDIEAVCESMMAANKAFSKSHQTLQAFAEMVIKNKDVS